MTMHLENSEEMLTFAPDDESQKRLVVRHRVFFDANYSRIRRLERSLIRNPQNSQSPDTVGLSRCVQGLSRCVLAVSSKMC